jgi:hypothetical protein
MAAGVTLNTRPHAKGFFHDRRCGRKEDQIHIVSVQTVLSTARIGQSARKLDLLACGSLVICMISPFELRKMFSLRNSPKDWFRRGSFPGSVVKPTPLRPRRARTLSPKSESPKSWMDLTECDLIDGDPDPGNTSPGPIVNRCHGLHGIKATGLENQDSLSAD